MTGRNFRARVAEQGQKPLFGLDSGWTPPASLPSLAGEKQISIDFETKGLDTSQPIGLAIGGGTSGRRFYFPFGHDAPGNLSRELIALWAQQEFAVFDGELVGANLNYDLRCAHTLKIKFPLVKSYSDVQIAEPLIDENRLEYNLDALSKDYLGEGKAEDLLLDYGRLCGFSTPKSIKENLWRFPPAIVGPYAEGDVDRPLRILPLQLKKIHDEELDEIYTVERKLIPILVNMTINGVPIDVLRAEELRARFVKERERWLTVVRSYCGPKAELHIGSTLVIGLQEQGLNVPRTKPSKAYPDGQDSVTKPFLEHYATNPLVKAILNGRKVNTLITTFFDGQILGKVKNGRVHPTWNQLKGDDTGTIARLSCSDPNLQFIPARDADWQEEEIAALVREVFIPEENEEWQRDDFSQIEYRFGAHFARGPGAENVRARYNSDPKTDFHKLVATMMGIPPDNKRQRKKVKIVNFTKGYGAGPGTIANTIGCSEEEAIEFINQYNRDLPFMAHSLEEASKWAQRRGFVVTIMNRRRRYPFWGPKRYRKESGAPVFRDRLEAEEYYGGPWKVERVGTFTAWNGKLQGSNADLIKKAMVDAKESGVLDVIKLMITVHDELGNSVPKTKAGDEAGRELTRVMERAIKISVPILVESGRGRSWAHAG